MIGLALILMQSTPAAAPFDEPTIPEPVLAEQRGGIRLPSGIDVTLSIDSRTAVNGAIVLQTVVKIDKGAPVVTAYAPRDGEAIAMTTGQTGMNGSPAATVTYDGQRGLVVTTPALSPSVSVGGSQDGTGMPVEGLQEVDLSQQYTSANGQIRKGMLGVSDAVEFSSSDLNVLHLINNAYGSAVLNSGSDRTIDTQTSISIDLRNAGPDVLGSTMLRVEGLAIDAVRGRF